MVLHGPMHSKFTPKFEKSRSKTTMREDFRLKKKKYLYAVLLIVAYISFPTGDIHQTIND